jgi:hypothetical protein
MGRWILQESYVIWLSVQLLLCKRCEHVILVHLFTAVNINLKKLNSSL